MEMVVVVVVVVVGGGGGRDYTPIATLSPPE